MLDPRLLRLLTKITAVGVLAACGAPQPVEIRSQSDAFEARGKHVKFRGTALPSIPWASVQSDTFMLHCVNILSWDERVVNKTVIVEGKLEKTDELTSDDPRARSLGGPIYVIRECQFATSD